MVVLPEFISFVTLWDEDYGPQVKQVYPTSAFDAEGLAALVFSAYQYFWINPEKSFQKSVFSLPLENISRILHTDIQTVPNPKVRGGLQPFAVVLVVPDYFSDVQIKKFDPILDDIAKTFANTGDVDLASYEKLIQDTFLQIQEIPLPPPPSPTFPFSAAVEDFQAGVKVFQGGAFKNAASLLLKALGRFEADSNIKLAMEANYLLAVVFTQTKDFAAARAYFRRLAPLARESQHSKYTSLASFMEGFCAFKLGDFQGAADAFSQFDPGKDNAANPMQYYALYGLSLAKLNRPAEAMRQLQNALDATIGTIANNLAVQRQRNQVLLELGIMLYRDGISRAQQHGFFQIDQYRPTLEESLKYLNESLKLSETLADYSSLFHSYVILGSLQDLLGNPPLAIDCYQQSLALIKEHKIKANPLPILDKLIQLRIRLGLHQENAQHLQEFLPSLSQNSALDLLSLAHYEEVLAQAYEKSGDHKAAAKEYLQALDSYRLIKQPSAEMVVFLDKMIAFFQSKGESTKVRELQEQLREIENTLPKIHALEAKQMPRLGGVKELWIFHSSTGALLFAIAEETRIDPDLLGGFLTALQDFSLNLSRQRLSSMVIGPDQFVFHYEDGQHIYILGRAHAHAPQPQIKTILEKIYRRFCREYASMLVEFSGDTDPFTSFGKILANLDFAGEAID